MCVFVCDDVDSDMTSEEGSPLKMKYFYIALIFPSVVLNPGQECKLLARNFLNWESEIFIALSAESIPRGSIVKAKTNHLTMYHVLL